MNIRNVAIIAHVDHGKTTLVNSLFTSSHTFRDNEQVKDRMLDSNPIEAERGITILAKTTSVLYKDCKAHGRRMFARRRCLRRHDASDPFRS